MTVRPFSLLRDWVILQAFWTSKGLPPVPEKYLPPTGLVVEANGILLCGGFLVKSDARQATLSYLSANPGVDRSVRSEALDTLILELAQLAKDDGFDMLGVASNVPALQKRYQRLGFILTDENVTCFAGRI